MSTSLEEIRSWLEEGKRQGASHVIIACDTFSWEDYPVFVSPKDDVRQEYQRLSKQDMTKVMEIYSLTGTHEIEHQLDQGRAFFLD